MGLATAKAFAEAGAAVVLADFNEEAVRTAADALVAAGHKALAVRCDVSDDAQVAAMVDRTVAAFGRLDAAFNNAGVMARIAPTAESTREDWDRVTGVNLRGVWSCMRHELKQMERQGTGAIVNNASVGALTGNPGIGSYIASKHGVVGLTRTAALEYVKRGIRVNAVNPGLIDTQGARDVVAGDESAYAEIAKGVPIGRAGRPEEIAAAVLWLCSPGASEANEDRVDGPPGAPTSRPPTPGQAGRGSQGRGRRAASGVPCRRRGRTAGVRHCRLRPSGAVSIAHHTTVIPPSTVRAWPTT